MTVFIALLKAVNVGGRGAVRMADLRDICAGLGFGDAETLLQSGNIVFSGEGTAAALASRLGKAVASDLGVRTTVIVRTAAELDKAIAANPFPDVAKADPAYLHVGFLADTAKAGAAGRLAAVKVAREKLVLKDRALFIHYPDGAGRSKVTTAVVEKALGGVAVTARNWNTVTKLQALAAAKGG